MWMLHVNQKSNDNDDDDDDQIRISVFLQADLQTAMKVASYSAT